MPRSWFQIKLLRPVTVLGVRIWNRVFCFYRAKDIELRVGMEEVGPNGEYQVIDNGNEVGQQKLI